MQLKKESLYKFRLMFRESLLHRRQEELFFFNEEKSTKTFCYIKIFTLNDGYSRIKHPLNTLKIERHTNNFHVN